MSRERFRRARLAGGSPRIGEGWRALVDRAVGYADERHEMLRIVVRGDNRPAFRSHDYERCAPGTFPVSAQLVLDVEARLTELEMQEAEMRKLMESEDVDLALRQRLRGTLERAREQIAARLRPDLKAVP